MILGDIGIHFHDFGGFGDRSSMNRDSVIGMPESMPTGKATEGRLLGKFLGSQAKPAHAEKSPLHLGARLDQLEI